MRLITLTVRNFRGFGPRDATINLAADLVLMFGPNAYGKTSLAEAIEWLFYGTTRRRQRGEGYSKNEYDGCFPNVHGGIPVEVSARIRTVGGIEHTITRRIINSAIGETSETFIDGNPAPFKNLGLVDLDAVHPVVAQHDLQSFIHSRPKERRDMISAAFGLEELTALKTALDGARKSFNATPPPGVEQARAQLRSLATVLTSLPETKALGLRWQKTAVEVKREDDPKALKSAGQRLANSKAEDVETLLDELRVRRQRLSQTVFDTTKLLPSADVAATVRRLTAERTTLAEACNALSEAIGNAVATAAAAYSTALLQFWETGLGFPAEADSCPMCEEQTLTTGKRSALQSRLSAARATLTGNQQVTAATTRAVAALARATQALQNTSILGFGTGDRLRLERLLFSQSGPLAAYLVAYDDLIRTTNEARESATKLSDFMARIPATLGDTTRAPELIANSKAAPQDFLDAISKMESSLHRYALAWNAFEPVLAAEIASNKSIAEIDTVGKGLKMQGEINILAAYDAVLDVSLSLMQGTETQVQNKQTQLLNSRGKEIKDIYDQMNPGAQVHFEGMEPGNEQLRLHASSFGVRMSAAANLSECQLNCLGLSFWLMRATTPKSCSGFILLDDPVQSMDDAHCEAFISRVIPDLCDKKQVIVLSHERRLIDRIRDLNKGRPTIVYHYDDYDKAGPSITQQVNLAVMLREVEGLAKGNEPNRSQAVDKLRKLVEQFVRDLHLKQIGQPVPAQYDSAKPSELLELYRQIPNTLPDEYQRLKDTVDFASSAHHQAAGYAVPVTTNITPHVERLRNLMIKYKLLP